MFCFGCLLKVERACLGSRQLEWRPTSRGNIPNPRLENLTNEWMKTAVPCARWRGFVDLDFRCYTVSPTLLGLMGIWQKRSTRQLGQMVDRGTHKSKSTQPRSTSTRDALYTFRVIDRGLPWRWAAPSWTRPSAPCPCAPSRIPSSAGRWPRAERSAWNVNFGEMSAFIPFLKVFFTTNQGCDVSSRVLPRTKRTMPFFIFIWFGDTLGICFVSDTIQYQGGPAGFSL